MKSKFYKTLILSSSLFFLNCGEESATSANSNNAANLSSSSTAVVPDENFEQENTESSASQSDISPESSESPSTIPSSGSESNGQTSSTSETSSSEASTSTPSSASATSSASAPSDSTTNSTTKISSSSLASSSSLTEVSSSSSEAPKPTGIFLAEGTEEEKEQLKIVYQTKTGWDGGAVLSYPEKLSDTQKHGVVIWGPGGGGKPEDCEGIIRKLASHGFVVVGIKESPGNATQGKASIDWLEKKNKDPNDPLYNKLDMTKVGAGGHSMGGLEAEQLLIQDSRVITAMLSNSGDLAHTAMTQVPTHKTISIVYGCNGFERSNAEADYNNPGVKAPACLIMMDGADYGHGSGFLQGQAAFVSWMRWHLGGEDFRKKDFVGTSGKYINGNIIGQAGYWKGQCKNF